MIGNVDDPTEIKYVDEVLKLLNVMTGDKRYEKIFQKKTVSSYPAVAVQCCGKKMYLL